MTSIVDPSSWELSTEDADDFDALYAELRGLPGIIVQAVPSPGEPGEQGSVVDLLTVAFSGGAVTVFLEIIKMLVESRGPSFRMRIRRGKDRVEISADDLDEVLPILKELMGGS